MYLPIDSVAKWVDLEHELAWTCNLDVQRISVSKKGSAWVLVAAGVRKKRRVVCFVNAHSLTACLELLVEAARANILTFHDDLYAKQ